MADKMTMPGLDLWVRAGLLSLLLMGMPLRAAEPTADKVVYHLGEPGFEQAQRTLNFVRNHVASDPRARIVVLAHSAGIDFLLKDATAPNGAEFAPAIHDLALKGVEFRVCNLTLLSRNINRVQVAADAVMVPSGVVELTRLQSREGYAYIRP